MTMPGIHTNAVLQHKHHNALVLFTELHTLKLWRADDALSLMNGLTAQTQTLGQQWSSVDDNQTKIYVASQRA